MKQLYSDLSAKQKDILIAAKHLFSTKGYAKTSVRDISKELEVRPSALYNHIAGKEEILEWIFADVTIRFEAIQHRLTNSNLTNEQKFAEFIKMYITEQLRDIEAFELYNEYWNVSPKLKESYRNSRKNFISFVKNILDANQVKKTVSCLTDEAPVIIILASLNLIPQVLENKHSLDIDCVVKDFQEKLLGGFHGA